MAEGDPWDDKDQFSHHLWIADENGNIYFIKRSQQGGDKLEGFRVCKANDRFNFDNPDEGQVIKDAFGVTSSNPDRSIAVVKMMLAMGVTAAAIPRKVLYRDPDTIGDIRATSYVINLASFDTEHAFWPKHVGYGDEDEQVYLLSKQELSKLKSSK